MTGARHPDPVAFHARGWLIAGGTETLVGVIAIASILTAALAHPGDNAAHSALLYLSGLLVVAGFITIAATLVAASNARGLGSITQQVYQVALQVGQNGYLSKELLAARTVDMVKMRDEIEATAHSLTSNAIADLRKGSDSQYQALTDQVAVVKGKLVEFGAEIVRQEEAREARIREIAKQAYADGLVDGASGVATVRQLRQRPDASTN